jgi:hypothetical protein
VLTLLYDDDELLADAKQIWRVFTYLSQSGGQLFFWFLAATMMPTRLRQYDGEPGPCKSPARPFLFVFHTSFMSDFYQSSCYWFLCFSPPFLCVPSRGSIAAGIDY